MKWPNLFLAWLIPDILCMVVGVARIVSMIVWASCAIGSHDIKSCSFEWATGLPQTFLGYKVALTWLDWITFAGICCIYGFTMGMWTDVIKETNGIFRFSHDGHVSALEIYCWIVVYSYYRLLKYLAPQGQPEPKQTNLDILNLYITHQRPLQHARLRQVDDTVKTGYNVAFGPSPK